MPTVTVTKNRNRSRRFTACNRHPSEPVTGFCALCLRDRLAGLDDIIDTDLEKNVVVCSRRTKGHGVGAPVPVPELRRSKSVAGEGFKNVVMDQRRSSCDVRPRTSLSDLFEVEFVKLNCSSIAENIENVGNSDGNGNTCDENEMAENENDEKIRVLDDDEDQTDLKTMKEMIEIELQNKRKQNIWETASEKMRRWRQKQKEKKKRLGNNAAQSEVADYGYGRRSCDTEPRFSIDVPHRLSVGDSQVVLLDEHRASWDGYMIARTIPRLTPMLSSGVDNVGLGNGNLQMQSISEDGGSSGGSGQSNSDCGVGGSSSSSSTKTVGGLGVDDVKLGSNAKESPANDVIFRGTKLVITEKELKDWHLNSVVKNEKVESVSNGPVLASETTVTNPSNGRKKVVSSSWRKVCNIWGNKQKLDDTKGDKKNVEHTRVNGFERGNSSKQVRNPGSVNSRNRIEHSGRDLVLDRNRSTRYSTSDIDSGLLRLYLTPFRNSRRSKSGKSRAPLMGTNGLQLN